MEQTKTSISAYIIADSINTYGDRLTTMVLTYPRIIHSEVMTHRMFSRNASSSRAVPVKKMIESIRNNTFCPFEFQKAHKGMQGTEYFIEQDKEECKQLWLESAEFALQQAEKMEKKEISKQIINRILEPYQYYQVIMTSGKEGLENFFDLRDHEAAEIHIQELARKMKEVYNQSKPKQLQAGEWHIPFGDNIIMSILDQHEIAYKFPNIKSINDLKIQIATARCARVSYTVVGEEGKEPNYDNDIKLHDRLLESGHFSPFEHCAKAMSNDEYNFYSDWKYNNEKLEHVKGWCNNFKGFIPYRYLIEKK